LGIMIQFYQIYIRSLTPQPFESSFDHELHSG
jgi:hypothetical protein